MSEQQLDEIRTVIARPKFDKLISDETRYYFFEMIYDVCLFTDITIEAKSNIRDPKDLSFIMTNFVNSNFKAIWPRQGI